MNHDYIKKFHLVDQYLLGKLTTDEAEEFEDHFIDCAECAEQLSITRSFIDDLKGLAVQEALSSSARPAPALRRWHFPQLLPLPSWAIVACCFVLVAGVFAFLTLRRLSRMEAELRQAKEDASVIRQQYQRELETAAASERQLQEAKQQLALRLDELESKLKTESTDQPVRGSEAPEVNFPIYALVSVVRGQVPTPVEIVLPVSSSSFALSIPVEDRREFTVYRVKILNQQGTEVWKQSGFKPDAYHALSLSLRSNFLKPATYDLRVEGLTQQDQWTTVGSYPFRVVRR